MDELRGQMHFCHLAPLPLIPAPLETFYLAILANPSSVDRDHPLHADQRRESQSSGCGDKSTPVADHQYCGQIRRTRRKAGPRVVFVSDGVDMSGGAG